MEDFTEMIKAIISAAKDIVDEAEYLKNHFAVDPETEQAKGAKTKKAKGTEPDQVADSEQTQEPAPVQPPSKEDVRKLLVEKTNVDGGAHKREVKALIRKYSQDGTLSGVDPGQYEALVEEAGVIGDA